MKKSNTDYSEKLIELFVNPVNAGEVKNPDGVGEAGNITCGDIMKITIKIRKNKLNEEVIEDIKFKTYGCAAAIASSSMLTKLVKGKTIEEAKKVTMKKISEELGGLPQIKMHCSSLALQAFNKAVENYKLKKTGLGV